MIPFTPDLDSTGQTAKRRDTDNTHPVASVLERDPDVDELEREPDTVVVVECDSESMRWTLDEDFVVVRELVEVVDRELVFVVVVVEVVLLVASVVVVLVLLEEVVVVDRLLDVVEISVDPRSDARGVEAEDACVEEVVIAVDDVVEDASRVVVVDVDEAEDACEVDSDDVDEESSMAAGIEELAWVRVSANDGDANSRGRGRRGRAGVRDRLRCIPGRLCSRRRRLGRVHSELFRCRVDSASASHDHDLAILDADRVDIRRAECSGDDDSSAHVCGGATGGRKRRETLARGTSSSLYAQDAARAILRSER